MKHGRRILTAALITIVGLLPATPALAQGGDMMARLEQELQRTEEIIQRAAEQVRDAGNARAAELVKKAMELQEGARHSFRNGRWELCASQTKAAREMAQRAIGLILRPEERVERVELELERTDEMIQGAREEVDPEWSESALALLAGAQAQQEKAWEYYRGNQLRPALRLTLQVREMLRKQHRRMSGTERDQVREHVEQVAELVRRASREARESGLRRRIQLAERAREMMMKAQEQIGEGRLRAAQQHLEQARRLAEQSLQRDDQGGRPEEFQAGLARYEERLEQLRQRLVEHPSREAARLVEESLEHQALAREQAEARDHDMERAMTELRIAMRLLERAGELVQ